MLPKATVEQVAHLLELGGHSQRQIAKLVGVSRGTVQSIASGRRGLHGLEPADESPQLSAFVGPAERCPSCGAKVYKPCLLCRTREFSRRQRELQLLTRYRRLARRRVA